MKELIQNFSSLLKDSQVNSPFAPAKMEEIKQAASAEAERLKALSKDELIQVAALNKAKVEALEEAMQKVCDVTGFTMELQMLLIRNMNNLAEGKPIDIIPIPTEDEVKEALR